jgi:hypothetical protein
MTEIVNLSRFRKAAAKQDATRQAAANRVKFGRDKATREREAQAEARRRAVLDGAALDQEKPEPA